mgnify:CR=1 FL=1
MITKTINSRTILETRDTVEEMRNIMLEEYDKFDKKISDGIFV